MIGHHRCESARRQIPCRLELPVKRSNAVAIFVDATEHAKVVFGRCPSLPTALPHSCFSPGRQPNDWVRTIASLRALGARGIPQLIRRDQRLHWSGTLIRSGLAASASCGNPPTRYRVFAASVVCFAVPYTVWIAGSLLRAERRTIAGGLLFPNIPTAP